MRKIEILGETIGKVYVKEYLGGKPPKYLCVCPCGETFTATSQTIRKGKIDCGCGVVSGMHKKTFKVGDVYYGSKILKVSKAYQNQTYYSFLCSKCGKVSERTHSRFLMYPLCPNCLKKEKSVKCEEEISGKFVGKTINGIKVLAISGRDESGAMCVTALCPVCGQEFVTRLVRIKRGIGSCEKCAEANLKIGHKISRDAAVEGTSILCIKPDRAINCNNTTGHKGISIKNGKYRAYINFKRKQYHLGLFSSLEDAVAARKAAEKKIYGDFLEWYAETYPEQWEKMKECVNKSL